MRKEGSVKPIYFGDICYAIIDNEYTSPATKWFTFCSFMFGLKKSFLTLFSPDVFFFPGIFPGCSGIFNFPDEFYIVLRNSSQSFVPFSINFFEGCIDNFIVSSFSM